MGNDLLFIFFLFLGTFIAGMITGNFWCKTNCDGEIVMMDNIIYLNITEADKEKLETKSTVKLAVRRKNFKGFNEQ